MGRHIHIGEKDGSSAVIFLPGATTALNVTAAGAVKFRRHQAPVDEYTIRLKIDNILEWEEANSTFNGILQLLKTTQKACEIIAICTGIIEARPDFRMEETSIKVSSVGTNVVYFNRQMAKRGPGPVDDDPSLPRFMNFFPKQGKDYPTLPFPRGWYHSPLIPVVDEENMQFNVGSNMRLPRTGTVFFEVKQTAFNFIGSSGPIKQIVVLPTVIAVKLSPLDQQQSLAQRRRFSC